MPYKGKVFSQDRGNCKKVLKGEYIEQEFILKLAQIDPLNVEVILPVTFFPSNELPRSKLRGISIGIHRSCRSKLRGIQPAEIKVGMDAMVVPEAPLGGQYVAKIKIVDSVIDAASGTFGVRLELPNPGNRLPAGLKCKVILEHSGS
jgi:membrane fusion protein (multidrug efflux system)